MRDELTRPPPRRANALAMALLALAAGPALADGAAASPPEAAAPRRLRFVVTAAYDYAFTDLLTVHYEGGGSSRIGANGGSTMAFGAAWSLVPSGAWELRGTVGVKYDDVTGSNGHAYYLAFPVDLLAAANVRPLRLAAGTSLALAPRVRGSGFLAPADLDLRNSLGVVGEVDWVFPFRGGEGSFSVGARYLWQKLEPDGGGRAVDASALGLVAGIAF